MNKLTIPSVVLLSCALAGCAPTTQHTATASNETKAFVSKPNNSTKQTAALPAENSTNTTRRDANAMTLSTAERVQMTAKTVNAQHDKITYPQLSGLTNQTVESKLNALLQINPAHLQTIGPDDSYTANYQVVFQAGPLLEIDETAYDYPQGAAHGEPTQHMILMNMETGATYQMGDLFRAGSNYLDVLSQQIRQEDTKSILDSNFSGVTEKDGFSITQTGVRIFFDPYEWAAFAAGFPTFDIPYDALESVINSQSDLWQALQRTDTQQDIHVQTEDMNKIKSLGYQPYRVSPTDAVPWFAQSNTPQGTPLYAFSATKGSGEGKLFFFLGEKYLGTDTLKDHAPPINLYPDGSGGMVGEYSTTGANGELESFTTRFHWNGMKLTTTPNFPSSFS
ncbi:RsiV family protein [Alicyclobacillus acidoterrestris]|uniref:RsiV family protein n=1 Tax=Alicyclobacillus acidoterrestris (strain ATCC 49025 / DSM 3922 / CIP 106132 / NCIMB 13137 / GD3B) TaxID=1356854 RepID=A0A9E6ZIC5_ALIAG|nr:RsiV family protein [Alicyclobacillus acidoterrestris]UNO49713.1 RsiV family protein [Alicyclobacillus acidoterrestris]